MWAVEILTPRQILLLRLYLFCFALILQPNHVLCSLQGIKWTKDIWFHNYETEYLINTITLVCAVTNAFVRFLLQYGLLWVHVHSFVNSNTVTSRDYKHCKMYKFTEVCEESNIYFLFFQTVLWYSLICLYDYSTRLSGCSFSV